MELSILDLSRAIKAGEIEKAKSIIAAGIDVNTLLDYDARVIMDAIVYGNLDLVKILVKAGADVNVWSEGSTAIMIAAYNAEREIYDYLYPLLDDYTRQYADKYGETKIRNTLIKRERETRKDIKQFIEDALFGNSEKVEKWIRKEINVNAIGSNGMTALMYAARQYHLPVVKLLLWMYENESKRIDDRIVSINQPHIRPIVRGKAGKPVEFGAKLSVSCFNNYVFLDHLSWDNFNESGDFKKQVEEYKNYTGYYPSSVHVDKIYRTRANRAWCKERGIRISGSPLGRPPKNITKETKKQAQDDERFRNGIEGKFGQAKRKYSLDCIMTKRHETSKTSIAITFLVINLSTLLRQISCLFLSLFLNIYKLGFIFPGSII